MEQYELDNVVRSICNSLKFAANALGVKTSSSGNKEKKPRSRLHPLSTWYNAASEEKRKHYFESKNVYRKESSLNNLENMRRASRAYKNESNLAFKQYKTNIAKKIKFLKSTNLMEYWNILNRRTDSNVLKHISLDNLHEHLAKLNATAHDGNYIGRSRVTVAPDPILDNDITHDEINKAINSLKCNKSCGLYQIINDYM